MTARAPKLSLYATFAAAAFLAALVLGRPELAALGAPFALVIAVGLTFAQPATVKAALRLGRELTVEGDQLETDLVLAAPHRSQAVELGVLLPDGLKVQNGSSRLLLRLDAGERRTLPLTIRCDRWGAYRPSDLVVRCSDRLGLRIQ